MKHSRGLARRLGSTVRRPAWECGSRFGILPPNLFLKEGFLWSRVTLFFTQGDLWQIFKYPKYYNFILLNTFHNQSIYLTLHFGFREHNMVNMPERCPSVFWLSDLLAMNTPFYPHAFKGEESQCCQFFLLPLLSLKGMHTQSFLHFGGRQEWQSIFDSQSTAIYFLPH